MSRKRGTAGREAGREASPLHRKQVGGQGRASRESGAGEPGPLAGPAASPQASADARPQADQRPPGHIGGLGPPVVSSRQPQSPQQGRWAAHRKKSLERVWPGQVCVDAEKRARDGEGGKQGWGAAGPTPPGASRLPQGPVPVTMSLVHVTSPPGRGVRGAGPASRLVPAAPPAHAPYTRSHRPDPRGASWPHHRKWTGSTEAPARAPTAPPPSSTADLGNGLHS